MVFFFACVALARFNVPTLTGPVVDQAGMIGSIAEARLGEALHLLRERGGSQLTVLTVPSLEGEAIELASIRVADTWKLGDARNDKGVLIMVARKERKVRIEVGQGNEGVLTDVQARRIIDETMLPLFRAGDFDSGLILGVWQVARATDPGIDLGPVLEGAVSSGTSVSRRPASAGLYFFIVLFLFLLFSGFLGRGGSGGPGLRRRGVHFVPGGFGGFGGRGGGFGGGGWGGGGGGFSGGGSSGSW